jgi:hypothetical protein
MLLYISFHIQHYLAKVLTVSVSIHRFKKEYVVEAIQNGHVYDVQCPKSFFVTLHLRGTVL